MNEPRWLCEPTDPQYDHWMGDAPWVATSDRYVHRLTTFSGMSIARRQFMMEYKPTKNVLQQVFYGEPIKNPSDMMGLSTMYNTLDPKVAQNAVNVVDGMGKRNLCSVWLIVWGPRTAFMAAPDGEPPVIVGECCVCVQDWRYAVRIANIDAIDPLTDVVTLMARAAILLPCLSRTGRLRPMFYVNRDVANRLKDANDGEYPTTFRETPIRVVDELRNDEVRVV